MPYRTHAEALEAARRANPDFATMSADERAAAVQAANDAHPEIRVDMVPDDLARVIRALDAYEADRSNPRRAVHNEAEAREARVLRAWLALRLVQGR